ncbi:hypothetical protein [Rhodococcus qingshengii]|uniref:hypothetical protein n=1 Tax=Rhodococcus qingshengii TaxID=334542 RepID=UPI0035D8264B
MIEISLPDSRDTEIYALRKQLSLYVGNEPTLIDEMNYQKECIRAVEQLCDDAEGPLDPQVVRDAIEGKDITVPERALQEAHAASAGWSKVTQREAQEMERDVLMDTAERVAEYPTMAALLRNLAMAHRD